MSVRALLDGRSFETFHMDVGLDDPVTAPPDQLPVTPLLAFADLEPTIVPCYPLVQHVAEKLHALTRSRRTRDNSRVKDVVDLVLLAEQQPFEAASLQAVTRATFGSRASDAVLEQLPEPPAWWGVEFRRMGRDVGLVAEILDAAMELLDAFLTPVLCGDARGEWLPAKRRWSG